MNSIKIDSLKVVITHKLSDDKKKKVVASNIYILIPGVAAGIGVASGTFGGNYNEQQAINELKLNPKRFKLMEGYEMAKAMKLL